MAVNGSCVFRLVSALQCCSGLCVWCFVNVVTLHGDTVTWLWLGSLLLVPVGLVWVCQTADQLEFLLHHNYLIYTEWYLKRETIKSVCPVDVRGSRRMGRCYANTHTQATLIGSRSWQGVPNKVARDCGEFNLVNTCSVTLCENTSFLWKWQHLDL